MKQKLQDIKLIVQNDRRIWAAAAAIVVTLIIWGIAGQGSWVSRRPSFRTAADQSTPMSDNNQYQDLIAAYQNDINNQAKILATQQETLTRVQSDVKTHQDRVAGIFETLVDRVEALSAEVQNMKANQTAVSESMSKQPAPSVQPMSENTIETFGLDKATVEPPPPPAKPSKYLFISPGDSVPVKLLTGVYAPVDGTPYPVVFMLGGPITGPDGSSLDLGEARLIAAATGSETEGRALFRLTDLAIRHKDGRRSVVKVDGWIVGEDGASGMKGKLIDKLGRLIAATAGYSFVAALGDRIDQQSDNIQVDNSSSVTVRSEDLDVASASALTDASNRIGEILLDRYEKLVPVVEVLSNRNVAAVFSQPAEVAVWEEDQDGFHTAALE
jgi:hypothetical protein